MKILWSIFLVLIGTFVYTFDNLPDLILRALIQVGDHIRFHTPANLEFLNCLRLG